MVLILDGANEIKSYNFEWCTAQCSERFHNINANVVRHCKIKCTTLKCTKVQDLLRRAISIHFISMCFKLRIISSESAEQQHKLILSRTLMTKTAKTQISLQKHQKHSLFPNFLLSIAANPIMACDRVGFGGNEAHKHSKSA